MRNELARQKDEIASLTNELVRKDGELAASARIQEEKIASERRLADQARENYEKILNDLRQAHEKDILQLKEAHEKAVTGMNEAHSKALESLKKSQDEKLEAIIVQMKEKTGEMLRQREKELTEGNRSSMDEILKPLKESMEGMRKAMQDNQETHIKNTTELSKQLEQAVREMAQKTTDIGNKADSLSEALTGRPKVQGCFGENFLDSMLANENLIEGLHYTREAANDDRSRPDFVFHFKDGFEQKDLIVDSKVSLTAYVRYVNASDETEREAALAEHLKSVHKHIDELAKKEYYRKNPNSFGDYVIMFMPMGAALQTAMAAEPLLWQEAYSKGVLLTSEQTIMPFLKIMQLTWKKYQHDTNLQKINEAAQNMIERVAAFYDSYKELGRKISGVCKEYNDGIVKLREDGRSITTSARQVIQVGNIRRKQGKEFSVPDTPVYLTSPQES